jgi:hypothetical protein
VLTALKTVDRAVPPDAHVLLHQSNEPNSLHSVVLPVRQAPSMKKLLQPTRAP